MSPFKTTQTEQDQASHIKHNASSYLAETINNTRVRNNRRNARARRQVYMKELERKWSDCVRLGAQANAEMQLAARRVAVENEFLRDLLQQRGLDEDALDTQIQQFWQSRLNGPPTMNNNEALLAPKPCSTSTDRVQHVPCPASADLAPIYQAPINVNIVTTESPIQNTETLQAASPNVDRVAADFRCTSPTDDALSPFLGFDSWLNNLYNATGSFNENFEAAFDTFMADDVESRDQQMPQFGNPGIPRE